MAVKQEHVHRWLVVTGGSNHGLPSAGTICLRITRGCNVSQVENGKQLTDEGAGAALPRLTRPAFSLVSAACCPHRNTWLRADLPVAVEVGKAGLRSNRTRIRDSRPLFRPKNPALPRSRTAVLSLPLDPLSAEAAAQQRRASKMSVSIVAGVAELADAPDSKSGGGDTPCGFDSHLRHLKRLQT